MKHSRGRYRYIGVLLEADHVLHEECKERLKKEYIYRASEKVHEVQTKWGERR